jgi:hypothetical protein
MIQPLLVRVDPQWGVEEHLDGIVGGDPGWVEAEEEGGDEDVHDAADEGDLRGGSAQVRGEAGREREKDGPCREGGRFSCERND